MPELPEVEVVRRQLASRLIGRTLISGDAHQSEKFFGALDALGSTIEAVDRRGKYLLFGLDDDRELIGHLGMTGSFSVVPSAGDHPECAAHDPYVRAVLRMDNRNDLVFRDVRRFGRLRVVDRHDYAEIPTLSTMGPEPLGDDFDGSSLYLELSKSNRPIKTQLLSQRPVAGVGNIYADEALHIARINPRVRRLGRERSNSLAAAIKQVLEAAISNGGTTLRDYRNADGESGSNQFALSAYGRSGEPCKSCGTELRSFVLDARTTTYCPSCQQR